MNKCQKQGIQSDVENLKKRLGKLQKNMNSLSFADDANDLYQASLQKEINKIKSVATSISVSDEKSFDRVTRIYFALKKIREIKNVKTDDSELFKACLKKSIKNITSWNTESEYQKKKINSLLNSFIV